MAVSNFTGPRESKLTIPRARKMAKPSKIPRIVNEIPGNLRANSQEKAVKLERKYILYIKFYCFWEDKFFSTWIFFYIKMWRKI